MSDDGNAAEAAPQASALLAHLSLGDLPARKRVPDLQSPHTESYTRRPLQRHQLLFPNLVRKNAPVPATQLPILNALENRLGLIGSLANVAKNFSAWAFVLGGSSVDGSGPTYCLSGRTPGMAPRAPSVVVEVGTGRGGAGGAAPSRDGPASAFALAPAGEEPGISAYLPSVNLIATGKRVEKWIQHGQLANC